MLACEARAAYFGSVLGRHDRAADQYVKCLDLDPNSLRSGMGLAHVYIQMGGDDEAATWIARVRQRAPRIPEVLHLAYWFHWARGENALAREIVAEAMSVDPVWAQDRLSHLDLRARRFAEARRRIEEIQPELTKEQPEEIALKDIRSSVYAYVLSRTGEKDRADRLLTRALAVEQSHPDKGIYGIFYKRLLIHTHLGETDRAIKALRRSVDEGWGVQYWRRLEASARTSLLREHPEYRAIAQDMQAELARQLARVRSGVGAN